MNTGLLQYIGCTIRRKMYAIRRFCRRWLDGRALSLSRSLSKLQPSPATRLEANSKANQLRGRSEEAQQSICNGFLQNTAIRARVAVIAERGDGHVSGLRPHRCSALIAAALQRHPSPLPPQRRPMRARVARHRQCPGQPDEQAEPAMASPVAVREGAGVAQDGGGGGGGAHSVVGEARLGGAPPLGQERSSRARQRIRRPPVPRLLNRVLLGGHSRGWLHIRVFQPESLVWGCPARQSSLGSSFRLVRNHRPPYSGIFILQGHKFSKQSVRGS